MATAAAVLSAASFAAPATPKTAILAGGNGTVQQARKATIPPTSAVTPTPVLPLKTPAAAPPSTILSEPVSTTSLWAVIQNISVEAVRQATNSPEIITTGQTAAADALSSIAAAPTPTPCADYPRLPPISRLMAQMAPLPLPTIQAPLSAGHRPMP